MRTTDPLSSLRAAIGPARPPPPMGLFAGGAALGDASGVVESRLSLLSVATAPLHVQAVSLEACLQQSDIVQAMLAACGDIGLPDWYLGAGGVAQTVWNVMHGFEPTDGVKDYDVVYFDPADLSVRSERHAEERVASRLADRRVIVDVKNQARVHLWYEQRFGRHLEPYRSSGEAIATWPTTATSIGVRYENGTFAVCAPFGLRDLFAMVVRPNEAIVTKDVYEEKVARWVKRWPRLTVIPW